MEARVLPQARRFLHSAGRRSRSTLAPMRLSVRVSQCSHRIGSMCLRERLRVTWLFLRWRADRAGQRSDDYGDTCFLRLRQRRGRAGENTEIHHREQRSGRSLHVNSVTLSGGPGFSLPAFAATTIEPGNLDVTRDVPARVCEFILGFGDDRERRSEPSERRRQPDRERYCRAWHQRCAAVS